MGEPVPLRDGLVDRLEMPDLSKSRSTDDRPLSRHAMAALSEALNHMDPRTIANSPATTQLQTILSPCYLHRRFDDAVDIEKVLEEITCDEAMSHSRLVQTATGVREISRQLQRRPIKRAVRNIMIVTKARDNDLVTLTRELAAWLMTTPRYGSNLGVNVYVDDKLRNSKRFDAAGLIAAQPRLEKMLRYWTPDLCYSTPEKFDLVLTLGGDGTVLFTSWLFQRIVPPILSFSLGSLGFLTPFEFHNYRDDLNKAMGGLGGPNVNLTSAPLTGSAKDLLHHAGFSSHTSTGASSPTFTSAEVVPDAGMRVNLRMRFTCTVHRAPKRRRTSSSMQSSKSSSTPSLSASTPTASTSSTTSTSSPAHPQADIITQFEVLNEVVIDRGPSPYVSNLELFGDDTLLTVIQADGCIFSTPTGSTAYSLSAGGSLCDPSIPAILLTPICPHTLSFRPMLLNDTISLRVAVPRGSRAGAWCSFDGKGRIELRQGDFVCIRASRYPFASVVGMKGGGWIDSVSRTLRWNTREARQKNWSGGVGKAGGGRGRRERIGSLGGGNVAAAAAGAATAADTIEEREEEDHQEDHQEDHGNDADAGIEDEDAEGSDEPVEFDIDFDEEDPSSVRPNNNGSDSGYGGETPVSDSPGSGNIPALPRKLDRMAELSL